MINKIKIWLNKPFPFYETYKQKIIIPVLVALFIMCFLIFFNPSHNTDIVSEQFLKVFIYGGITFFVMFFYNTVLPLIFYNLFDIEKWDIKKTIFFSLLTIVSIGLANGLFAFHSDNIGNNNHVLSFLLSVLFKTFTIGVFPAIFFIFFREKRLYQKHQLLALKTIEKLNKSKQSEQMYSEKIRVGSENTKDKIEIAYNDLYCIKSEGNYCMFFFNKNNLVEKKLIRSSLNKIEQANNKSDKIIRCHKSYIINLDKVTDITGNARGYSFLINELGFKIPGSRSLSKTLIAEIRNN